MSLALARWLCLLVLAIFAAGVVCCHAAQCFGWTFRIFADVAASCAAAILAGSLGLLRRVLAGTRADRAILAALIAMAVLSTLAALCIHSPNIEDCYYCANAVYHLEHPAVRMSYLNYSLPLPAGPNTLYFSETSVAHEYVEAAAAYWTGMRFASAYYVLGPAIHGTLLPLVTPIWLFPDKHETAIRSGASGYVGDERGSLSDLVEVMKEPMLRSIVLAPNAAANPDTANALTRAGFTDIRHAGPVVVAVRHGQEPD